MIMKLDGGKQVSAPSVGLSIITIDRKGIISASGYTVLGSQIIRYGIEPDDPAMAGRITVNSNCTGIVEWDGDTISELIVLEGGNEINSINISSPVGAATATGRWKRISPIPDLHLPAGKRYPHRGVGTYVACQNGINMISGIGPIPAALLGRASIHKDGSTEMSGTAVVAGKQMPFTFEDGEWEEGELACTGTLRASLMAGGIQYMGEIEGWFVVLDGGKEIWGISIADPSGVPVSLGIMKRVSMWPSDLK
jgi:hypothetical protein